MKSLVDEPRDGSPWPSWPRTEGVLVGSQPMTGRDPACRPFLPADVSLLYVATVASTIRGFLSPYAAHFRSLGWRVDAAAGGDMDPAALRDEFDHVHELPLSRSILDLEGIMRSERAMSSLLEYRPDIVHVHTPIAGFVTRVAVRREPAERRPAMAYTAHGFHFYEGGNPAKNALYLTAERVAGRWTDRLVVINDEDEAAAERHRIVPKRRLVRMPGIGVDTQWYARSSIDPGGVTRAREERGVPADVPLFVVVAELSSRKRVGDAIAALACLQHKDAQLILAGGGPERARLEGLAGDLGLRDRVQFLGFIPDVRPVVCAATALILPSKHEGLARSVMEALALEVPVITSTARGNRELVGADSGLIFATGDVDGLASAMDWLIDNPERGRAMGQRGRARMVAHYDLQILFRRHEDLYRGLLAERRGA